MIIPKEKQLTAEQLEEIRSIARDFGVQIQPINGKHRSVYAIIGDERDQLLRNRIEGLHYIDRVDNIQSAYKLMSRDAELARHHLTIGGVQIGGGSFTVMAGHCTIDPKNPQLFIESSHAIKEAGAQLLRGGVWKPRTLPNSYQGDVKCLDHLMEAKAQTGLPVVTEVMDEEQLKIAVEAGVDVLQVGARNALNYSLLKQIGKHIEHRPEVSVLLKRSMHMGKLDEFIAAGEYIVNFGNPNIMLCPRGTVPSIDGYRNYPDECITPLLKEKTWAPVVVDPSHSVGKAMYVPNAALAAASYGADGLIIECSLDPKRGIGDDPKQSITPEVLKRLIVNARQAHDSAVQFLS